MALHFTEEELKSRRDHVVAELNASGLAALLIFRQESMYYLTGYDTTGYSQFQCLYLGADGRLILLTRSADLRQARLTSVIEDIRIWVDRAGVNPGQDLWDILEEQGCHGRKVGVELEAYCLTGRRWEYVRAAMEGKCQWEDQSELVSRLRLVKSDAEIGYVRRAAVLGRRGVVGGAAYRQGGHARAGHSRRHDLSGLPGRRRLHGDTIHHRLGRDRAERAKFHRLPHSRRQ